MKHTTILIAIFAFCSTQVHSQNASDVQHSQGAIFLNVFGTSSKFSRSFTGYSMQSDITLWKSFHIDRKFSPRIGIGFTHFWYLGAHVDNDNEVAAYLPLRFGYDYKTGFRSLIIFSQLSNYIKIYPQRKYNFRIQERGLYANIDFGIRFKTGKKWTFNVSSPVTILPMFYRKGQVIHTNPPSPRHNLWVENVGVNVGFMYRFLVD